MRIMTLACLLAAATLPASAIAGDAERDGPLGMHMGMSKASFDDLEEMDVNWYMTSGKGKTNSLFDFYNVAFSKKSGLCAIAAAGRDVMASPSGKELREEMDMLSSALNVKYGKPTSQIEEIEDGSALNGEKMWMKALASEDLSYSRCWFESDTDKDYPYNVESVCATAAGLDEKTGYISVRYEFDNFSECEAEDAKAGLSDL